MDDDEDAFVDINIDAAKEFLYKDGRDGFTTVDKLRSELGWTSSDIREYGLKVLSGGYVCSASEDPSVIDAWLKKHRRHHSGSRSRDRHKRDRDRRRRRSRSRSYNRDRRRRRRRSRSASRDRDRKRARPNESKSKSTSIHKASSKSAYPRLDDVIPTGKSTRNANEGGLLCIDFVKNGSCPTPKTCSLTHASRENLGIPADACLHFVIRKHCKLHDSGKCSLNHQYQWMKTTKGFRVVRLEDEVVNPPQSSLQSRQPLAPSHPSQPYHSIQAGAPFSAHPETRIPHQYDPNPPQNTAIRPAYPNPSTNASPHPHAPHHIQNNTQHAAYDRISNSAPRPPEMPSMPQRNAWGQQNSQPTDNSRWAHNGRGHSGHSSARSEEWIPQKNANWTKPVNNHAPDNWAQPNSVSRGMHAPQDHRNRAWDGQHTNGYQPPGNHQQSSSENSPWMPANNNSPRPPEMPRHPGNDSGALKRNAFGVVTSPTYGGRGRGGIRNVNPGWGNNGAIQQQTGRAGWPSSGQF